MARRARVGDPVPFERLLVATGRRPNSGGLEALGLTIGHSGIEVDERLRAAENVWAIGDVTGIALFTHVGKYHARVVAYDIDGPRGARRPPRRPGDDLHRPAGRGGRDIRGRGREVAADLHAAPVDLRAAEARRVRQDRRRPGAAGLNGAVAVGPEAVEWLQQLTLAIRAETPIEVLLDVIQPYPTFSEAVFLALRELGLDL